MRSVQGANNQSLERVEEIDQVLLRLSRKTDAESLIIKVHRVQESGSRAVVEVGCPCSQPSQNGPFDLADVGAIARNQCTPRIGDHESLARERTGGALERGEPPTGDVAGWRLVWASIGNADIQRRLHRMIADIGCVMTGPTEPGNVRRVEHVVEACDTRNIDFGLVEQALATGDRPATRCFLILALQARPHGARVEAEDSRVEGCAFGIQSQWIIDADEELGELQRERDGSAACTSGLQLTSFVVEDLSGEDAGLEIDDLCLLV